MRTSAIDQLIDRFLTTSPSSPKQIISLGAGTDTRYFRLRDKYPTTRILYHEIDFPMNTAAKLIAIHQHPQLHTKLTESTLSIVPTPTTYYTPS